MCALVWEQANDGSLEARIHPERAKQTWHYSLKVKISTTVADLCMDARCRWRNLSSWISCPAPLLAVSSHGPELLSRNVFYLESSVISRSWRKVSRKGHTGHPGCLRAQLQLFLRALVCTSWISGWNSTTGSDTGSGTRSRTMPKSPSLIDLNWILSELRLEAQLRPS